MLTTWPGQQAVSLAMMAHSADPVSLLPSPEPAVGSRCKERRPRREASQFPPGMSRVIPALKGAPSWAALIALLTRPFSAPAVEQLPCYL